MTIHPADNQSTLHHQLPNPTLSIQFNATSSDSNNNLSSVKSENKSSNRSNKIVIKKTSTTTITTTNRSSIILTSSGVKTIVGKYNRRNNPELEKRRIHHCDFMGKFENSQENFKSKLDCSTFLTFSIHIVIDLISYFQHAFSNFNALQCSQE